MPYYGGVVALFGYVVLRRCTIYSVVRCWFDAEFRLDDTLNVTS